MHGWKVHDSVVLLQPEYLCLPPKLSCHARAMRRPKRTEHSSASAKRMFAACCLRLQTRHLRDLRFRKKKKKKKTEYLVPCYTVEFCGSEKNRVSRALHCPAHRASCTSEWWLVVLSAGLLSLCATSSIILRNRKCVIGYSNDRIFEILTGSWSDPTVHGTGTCALALYPPLDQIRWVKWDYRNQCIYVLCNVSDLLSLELKQLEFTSPYWLICDKFWRYDMWW